MLGSLILYLKGMRIMMFQLSGFTAHPQTEESQLGLRVWAPGHRACERIQ